MHSNIYEIRDKDFPREVWADDAKIADEDYRIDGADYWSESEQRERDIEEFFVKSFPEGTFRVIKNEPDKTAVIEFTGNVRDMLQNWCDKIVAAASSLTTDNICSCACQVKNACNRALGLSDMFYIEDWIGSTITMDEFLDYLRCRTKDNNGKSFRFYVGQVFDYHN